jgi:DNA-binding transcriptional regulator YdaS (Cro superfamily)
VPQAGATADAELRQEFGIPREPVALEHAVQTVGGQLNRVDWDSCKVKLLGTASDAQIATRLGVTKTAVRQQRVKRAIPPFGKTRAELNHDWTQKQLEWLGKLSDAEIARRIGVSPPTVGWKRRCMGMAASKQGKGCREWSTQELAMLGKLPDTEVAAELRLHRHQVALKRMELGIDNYMTRRDAELWTAEVIQRLGKEPDHVIAKELGVKPGRVSGYRQRHGIRRIAADRGKPE